MSDRTIGGAGATSAWGEAATRYFYELTPERILDAVERSLGVRCTGRALALNSMENRVYELEIELPPSPVAVGRWDASRIVKFYRPGRWSEAQIREEHQFLADLNADEIPAVAPLPFVDGDTLHQLAGTGLWYAVFPKIGGRSPDELSDEQLQRVGRLLARVHNVGAARAATQRVALTVETYATANLRYLIDSGAVPASQKAAYVATVEQIAAISGPWLAAAGQQRIHGDCHLGNVINGRDGMFFVDFDDMVRGPAVQDIWLLLPGRDDEARRQLEVMLAAYETMRPFDRRSLRLIEALRALRFVHFSAWIAKRWQDPAFPRAFPHFGGDRYWAEQLADLREQLDLLRTQV